MANNLQPASRLLLYLAHCRKDEKITEQLHGELKEKILRNQDQLTEEAAPQQLRIQSALSELAPNTFKVMLVGNGGVETNRFRNQVHSLVLCALYAKFLMLVKATVGVDVIPSYAVRAPDSELGQEKFGGLRDGYYIGGKAAILFFDVTSRYTYKNLAGWHRDVTRVCGDVPMVLVGNKVDITERVIKPKSIIFHRQKKRNMPYFEVSAMSNYNIEKPFLWLARALLKDENLNFVERPFLAPPAAPVDLNLMAKYDAEIAASPSIPLPDDDDEEI